MHPLEKLPVSEKIRKNKKLSILMPFLNEEKIIVRNTHEVIRVLKELNFNYEIILIDDGSRDNSYKILKKEFSGHPRVKIVRNYHNFGKGWALKTGYEFSTGDYIMFLDSDLELSPYHIPNFFRVMIAEKADAVIGSKLHHDSILTYPLKRRIMSLVYYSVIKLLFGLPVMDSQTGIKLFKREALEMSLPKVLVKHFAFDIELLIVLHKNHKKIAPAPIELKYTRGSFGNIKLNMIIKTFIDTLAVFFRDKILRFYNRPMGQNKQFFYSIILFPQNYDRYEKESLRHFLKIQYNDYEIIYAGKKAPGIRDPRIKFCRTGEESFSLRMIKILKERMIKGDIIVLSALDCYPDERFLFSSGRILSLPHIGATGGYVVLRNRPSSFELLSYSVLSSYFLNLNLNYRYKPLNYKEVNELQLNGLFIKKEYVDIKDLSIKNHLKLEYLLCRQIKKRSKKISYSPDIMLYRKFPQNNKELFGLIIKNALLRARQYREHSQSNRLSLKDGFYILSLFILLLIPASVISAVLLKNILFAVPVLSCYLLMLFTRILFSGFKKGVISFAYLVILQITYGIYFITGLFSK